MLNQQIENKPGLFSAFESLSPEDAVKALSELIPEPQWPTLLLAHETPSADSNWLANAMRTIELFLVATPKLAVGLAISEQEYRSFIELSPHSRSQTLAREGYIPIEGVTAAQVAEQFVLAGLPVTENTCLQQLVDEGLSEDTATSYLELAKALTQPAILGDQARSAAERFLFAKLNSHPPTAGFFRLNDKLGFRHGSKRAEADLVDEHHKVVIEVDGAYFHLTPEQYRRDRMKDWKYQQHGFFVLRFLAEDVLSDWPRIIAMATEAVEFRSVRPSL